RIIALDFALAARYGEDFVLNSADDVLRLGAPERIRAISDIEEQRCEADKAIYQGLDVGTIDRAKVADNPDLLEWIDVHRTAREMSLEKAQNASVASQAGRDVAVSLQTSFFAKSLSKDASLQATFNNKAIETLNREENEQLSLGMGEL